MNSAFDIEIVADLTTEPVTLAEARNWIRVDYTVDDTIIGELITAAREDLEKLTGLSFGEKTLKVYWISFTKCMELPYGPIGEVSECIDDEDEEVDFELKGLTFKKLEAYSTEGLQVTYTAGYETLPKKLKYAILKMIAYLYEKRQFGIENIDLMKEILQDIGVFRRNLWFGL